MTTAERMVDALLAAWGPQGWWPGESPFEICVGAILVQNTAWTGVEKAIAALKGAGALTAEALAARSLPDIETMIRPAGTFRVKARRLKRFSVWVREECGGDVGRAFSGGAEAARERLLAISGIGPETADAIVLYAGRLATFPADAYARRILARHGWLDGHESYEDVREWFLSSLPRDVPLLNEAHALVVKAGKEHCRAKAKCDGCPLAPMLPAGGVREPEPW